MKKKKTSLSLIFTTAVAFCLPVLVSVCIMASKTNNAKLINTSAVKYTASNNKNFVYLTDLWDTDKMLRKESSWKDARALKINQNEPGNLISLNIGGKQKYFINGLFAHAESTLVFDIRDFTKEGFDTFNAFVGVDTYAASNGNGVQFTILGSEDGSTYTKLLETGIFKGTSEAKEIIVPIKSYNYLMLFVDDINGNNSSDHAVYANAMLYNSETYTPKADTEVNWIKDTDTYDADLKQYSAEQIIADENLELELLQRTLVNRVGYQIMQAYATSDDADKVAALKWLFTNYKILKTYIVGGEPLGNYVNSFNVLASLYHEYKDDLTNVKYTEKQRETFLKMMMSISLTHSGTVALWTTGLNGSLVKADPVKRYDAYKRLYLNEGLPVEYTQTFNAEVFESLTVEEMRWVVDARLSDEEIPWLNWYSSHLEGTKYEGRNGMDPYTYIWYDDSFDWRYTDPEYYKDNTDYCGVDLKSKFTAGFKRGQNCNEEYSLKTWGVDSNTPTKPRLWIIWEEDGVCGAISKTGENLNNSYGMVAAVTRQPAHAAYLVQNKKKNDDGTFTTTWGIGNDVSGWAKSSGTEKGERLPLNWGTTTNKYASNFNGSYVILAQRAFDDFDNYIKSLEYTFVADLYDEDVKKQRQFYRDIVGEANIDDSQKNINAIQTFNLDGWYGLIETYLNDESLTSDDYYKLSYEIMANLEEFPLAMNDMLNLIDDKLDGAHKLVVDASYKRLLEKLSTVKNDSTEYAQGQAVRQVAQLLLGEQEETLSFSFDGENANKIVLATAQPFEYSLNYSYNASTKTITGDWTQVTSGNTADLTDRLNEINVDNDIVIHILVDGDRSLTSNSVTVIDIKDSDRPTKLYANDLENRVIGTTDSMEWKMDTGSKLLNDANAGWVKFTDKLPDLTGNKTILVRDGAHDVYLPSDYVSLSFEKDSDDKTKVYVPTSRLKVTVSSQNSKSEAGDNILDGNINTFWHNLWNKTDTQKWLMIEVDEAIDLSKIEYLPRQDSGSNGRFLKSKLEVSLDGENWTTINDNIVWTNDRNLKTYILDTPTLAKFIRLTALESEGGFASAAMVNVYESTTARTSVEKVTATYMTSGYIYDGNAKEPELIVRNGNEPLVLNEDYTLEYQDNINPGTGKIILKGIGAYKGSKEFNFEIQKADYPLVMPDKNIIVAKDVTRLIYAGDVLPENWYWEADEYEREIAPGETIEVKVMYFGEDAEFYNNIETTVFVTRENGSSPVINLSYNAKLTFDIDSESIVDFDYFKNLLSVTDEEDTANGIEIALELNSDLTDWNGSTWNKVGTYHVGYTATDSDNNKTDYIITFTLYSASNPEVEINNNDFTFEVEELSYTGNAHKPHVVVKDDTGHALTINTDYEIVDYKNNTNAGIASASIKGIKLYKGDVTTAFEIKKAKKPTVMPSGTITVSSSTTRLADIELPMGWVWANAGTVLKDGNNELKIIFAGDANHEYYEMNIMVVKETVERGRIIEDTDIVDPVEQETDNNITTPSDTVVDSQDSSDITSNEDNNSNTSKDNSSNVTNDTTDKSGNTVDDNKKDEENTSKTENSTNKETNNNVVEEEKNNTTAIDKNYFILLIPAGIIVALIVASIILIKKNNKE